ncbi:arginyltransferase [Leptospira wolffii]|uniref:arginyltransferase n=1 Tax=Leptospira wolffii TaxID=409998 RepID=UPI001084202C|nr:arginyltransferase [Leptospira wolffii]TGK60046.1 arginyltransferase [Leptospira wolffii]TGK72389.1 arginyltransferase [Leptospira wolffii]TGK76053.1 arginyltransferase [Leptospira wolffii]TGL30305.1 arginyltransferase [Leptospira wolffii]
MDYAEFMRSLPLSPESGCSYYPERMSRIRGFSLTQAPTPIVLDRLLDFGFRRAGNFFYRTVCQACSDCLSYRIRLSKFEIHAKDRRLLKKNRDMRIEFGAPKIDSEKEELYLRYQRSRHTGSYGDSSEEILKTMRFQMYEGADSSGEIRILDSEKLIGWILLDLGEENVSAVYSVFDPERKERGLGNFLVLGSILWAKENGFKNYHLGLYLPGHPKMDYKAKWKPAEILDKSSGLWLDSEEFLEDFRPGTHSPT